MAISNANTRGATGWCLDVHDLAIAKAVAGRDKDRSFLRHVVERRMVDEATLLSRLAATPLDDEVRRRVSATIGAAFEE